MISVSPQQAFSNAVQSPEKRRRRFACTAAIVLGSICSISNATIPSSQRAALIALYINADGDHWFNKSNWKMASGDFNSSGTECSWFGITCDAQQLTVQSIQLSSNKLSGEIPPLDALLALRELNLSDNYLNGTIPALSALASLRTIDLSGNYLVGQIPNLQGLIDLNGFVVSNNKLTGELPSLLGLPELLTFRADRNELSGGIPKLEGASNLQDFFVNNNQLTGVLPSFAALKNLVYFVASSNRLSGPIPSLSGPTNLEFFFVGDNQLTGSVAAPPPTLSTALPTIGITASLCPNSLTPSIDARWDAATGITPWASACVPAVNLDQFGLTGSWYDATYSGQGFQFGVIPDLNGVGDALLFAGWYTFAFDVVATGGPRWYTLQGKALTGSGASAVTIYTTYGGSFDATDPPGKLVVAGVGTLSFSDCTHASFTYNFSDLVHPFSNPFYNATGTIPLTRLSSNTTCSQVGDNGAKASDFLLSGAWFDPLTSGQGLIFDINPGQNLLAAGWYTFVPHGNSVGGAGSQAWYTLQTDQFIDGASAISKVPIFETTGGQFMTRAPVATAQVGQADISFSSCTTMTLAYAFTSGPNAGLTGKIDLVRIGPAPVNCSL